MTDKGVYLAKTSDDLRERFQAAALDLFQQYGYEQTTAAQIAAKVGVTERTFFRYFADKREVLFDGEERVREALLGSIADAPEALRPIQTLFRAFHAFRPELEARRFYAKPRQELISITPALQERELAKISALSDALAAALQVRGVETLEATLTAQIGMSAFAHATIKWLEDDSSDVDEWFDLAYQSIRRILVDNE